MQKKNHHPFGKLKQKTKQRRRRKKLLLTNLFHIEGTEHILQVRVEL